MARPVTNPQYAKIKQYCLLCRFGHEQRVAACRCFKHFYFTKEINN